MKNWSFTSLENYVYTSRVGFEDMLGWGDLDFNDFTFRLNNVIDPTGVKVPEPSALFLMALGFLGIAVRLSPTQV